MKNFEALKKEIDEKMNETKDKSFSMTPSQILLMQAQMFGMISTNQELLKKIINANNIELKDDDGNVFSVEEFCEYHNKLMTFTFFDIHEEK